MKDYVKRLFVLSFFWLFIGFLGYNLIVGNRIVQSSYQEFNYPVYAILIVLSLYVVWCYGLVPTHVKFSRSVLFVIGLVALVVGKTLLANDGTQGIFFGDIASVFGVITLIIGPTGLIFTQNIKKQKEEKDLEIIEV